jgi:hypothetical protein
VSKITDNLCRELREFRGALQGNSLNTSLYFDEINVSNKICRIKTHFTSDTLSGVSLPVLDIQQALDLTDFGFNGQKI